MEGRKCGDMLCRNWLQPVLTEGGVLGRLAGEGLGGGWGATTRLRASPPPNRQAREPRARVEESRVFFHLE